MYRAALAGYDDPSLEQTYFEHMQVRVLIYFWWKSSTESNYLCTLSGVLQHTGLGDVCVCM